MLLSIKWHELQYILFEVIKGKVLCNIWRQLKERLPKQQCHRSTIESSTKLEFTRDLGEIKLELELKFGKDWKLESKEGWWTK